MKNIDARTTNLAIFGEEFEKHGGLRILSTADTMHDEDPIDDMGYYVDRCYSYLDEAQVLAGYAEDEDLIPLFGACFDLRLEYGHGVWVGAALLDYLRGVKGADNAEASRDRMIAEAEAQFSPLLTNHVYKLKVDHAKYLRDHVVRLEKELQTTLDRIAETDRELAEVE